MVMTMGVLGRGDNKKLLTLSSIHIVGAALGGAIVGGILGIPGQLFPLSHWRVWIVLAIAVFAIWQGITQRPAHLGLHRQVPRRWTGAMPLPLCYFLWGVQLGSGVAIVIPYSIFLILMGVQATSGILLGLLSGACFGGVRQLVALLPLTQPSCRLEPENVGTWRAILYKPFSLFNVLAVIGGTLLLIWAGLH